MLFMAIYIFRLHSSRRAAFSRRRIANRRLGFTDALWRRTEQHLTPRAAGHGTFYLF